jgi:hypothetical protein
MKFASQTEKGDKGIKAHQMQINYKLNELFCYKKSSPVTGLGEL